MLIVVEGPEGAGKSTWCQEFQKAWPHTVVTVNHRPGSSNEEQIHSELRALGRLPNEWAILFDRWFYSDYVYKPLQGKALEMDMDLENAEAQFGQAIDFRVLLLPELEVLQERAQPNDAGVDKGLERSMYLQLATDWPRDVRPAPVVEKLLDLLEQEKSLLAVAEQAQVRREAAKAELKSMGVPTA